VIGIGSQLHNVSMQIGRDACVIRTNMSDLFYTDEPPHLPIVLQEASLLDLTINGLDEFRAEPWNAHKNNNFVAHANAAGALAESLVNQTSRKLQRV
jgi:hypothetical protein